MYGPQTPFSQHISRQKYQSHGESFEDSKNRVAATLLGDTPYYQHFRHMLLDQKFLPGGRIQANIGKSRHTTAINCYMSPIIEDSFCGKDGFSKHSIMGIATMLASTLRAGGGVGTDWSTLRPKGSLISTLDSPSSGPIAFMAIFDSVCKATISGGSRRGAQMFSMDISHPDVEHFIAAKHDQTTITSANMSLKVTDEFMECLQNGKDYTLSFDGKHQIQIDPEALWEQVMRSAWDHAEPGVMFIDTIHRKNNLGYCERIIGTNPCGEVPLPPNGACLLGSFNLTKYVKDGGVFDYPTFMADIPFAVRALDEVIEKTHYPHPEQKKEMLSKRRIGIGVTGVANAIEKMGYQYGSPGFLNVLKSIMGTLRNQVYLTSVQLAKEKSPFPLFDLERYIEGEFIKSLPIYIQDCIAKHGIRNSHLLAVAPTGTISLSADNISSSIEPVFRKTIRRTYLDGDDQKETVIEDYGWRKWGVDPKTAEQVSADEHLKVLALTQRYVDQAVSKTINTDTTMPWTDFKNIYRTAWESGCKGVSVFVDGAQREGILKDGGDEAPEAAQACHYDPNTGTSNCGD